MTEYSRVKRKQAEREAAELSKQTSKPKREFKFKLPKKAEPSLDEEIVEAEDEVLAEEVVDEAVQDVEVLDAAAVAEDFEEVEATEKPKKKKKQKKEGKSKINAKAALIYFVISLVLWVSCVGVYGGRFVYFYKDSKKPAENLSLVQTMTQTSKLSTSGNGLTLSENGYLFKGKAKDNYIWYSNILWRAISIDEAGNITMVSDDNLLTMTYSGSDQATYEDSYINQWLTSDTFQNVLEKPETYLVKTDFSCDSVEKYSDVLPFTDKYNGYVGLLNTNQYLFAGGVDGFLNTSAYFWTMTRSKTGSAYVVVGTGGIDTTQIGTNSSLQCGIRPVVVLKGDLMGVSGVGTKEIPYVIGGEEQPVLLNEAKPMSYVEYSGMTWRVVLTEKGNTKLVLDDVIKGEDQKPVLTGYGSYQYRVDNSVGKILTEFKKKLDGEYLIKGTFYTGKYSNNTSYTVASANEKSVSSEIGLPSLYEFASTAPVEGAIYWLSNYQSSTNRLVWSALESGRLMSDLYTAELAVRPVVYIKSATKVVSGTGSLYDPYKIGLEG